MNIPQVVTAITLNANNYVPIDIDNKAVTSIVLQCRTAVDVYIADNPSPGANEYWTLKQSSTISFDTYGVHFGNEEGSELLSNGTFTGNANGWTLGGDWSYAANTVSKAAGGATTLSQVPATPIAIGEMFKLVFTLSGAGFVGNFTPSVGGTNGAARSAIGTFTDYIMAADTTSGLIFTPSAVGSICTIDDISLKKISGSVLWAKASAGTPVLEILYLR